MMELRITVPLPKLARVSNSRIEGGSQGSAVDSKRPDFWPGLPLPVQDVLLSLYAQMGPWAQLVWLIWLNVILCTKRSRGLIPGQGKSIPRLQALTLVGGIQEVVYLSY